jgi:bifunctional non-homologous end joining protein LigD
VRNRCSSFVIDGEAVLLGVDGVSDFNGLHSRKHDDEVQFDACDSQDLRKLPLSLRKTNLFLSEFEQGEIGPDLVRHAYLLGLEGLVSKHRESSYRAGRFDRWVKVRTGCIRRSVGCWIIGLILPTTLGHRAHSCRSLTGGSAG